MQALKNFLTSFRYIKSQAKISCSLITQKNNCMLWFLGNSAKVQRDGVQGFWFHKNSPGCLSTWSFGSPPPDYQSREVAPLKCRLDLEVPAAQLPILSVEILALWFASSLVQASYATSVIFLKNIHFRGNTWVWLKLNYFTSYFTVTSYLFFKAKNKGSYMDIRTN